MEIISILYYFLNLLHYCDIIYCKDIIDFISFFNYLSIFIDFIEKKRKYSLFHIILFDINFNLWNYFIVINDMRYIYYSQCYKTIKKRVIAF